jgi:hypothetical protein
MYSVHFRITVTSAPPTTNQQEVSQGQCFWCLVNSYQATSASLALPNLDCTTSLLLRLCYRPKALTAEMKTSNPESDGDIINALQNS